MTAKAAFCTLLLVVLVVLVGREGLLFFWAQRHRNDAGDPEDYGEGGIR